MIPLCSGIGGYEGIEWHRLKTVTFTKQTGQFSQKSTPLSNGIEGRDKAYISANKHKCDTKMLD